MSVGKYYLLVFLLSVTVSATATEPAHLETETTSPAKALLSKMLHAMATLNYQGTVAFLKNGKLEPMKYFHAAKQGAEQERLLSLNSPMREIIRDAGKVSCFYKTTEQLVVDYRPFERSFLLDLPDNLNELDALYQIELLPDEDVAMLPVHVILIKPKDTLRYSHKIWLSKQQLLPLKVSVYDEQGEVLEQMVFTELHVFPDLPFVSVNKPDPNNPVQQTYALQAQSSEHAGFYLKEMPKGFKEVFFTRRPMHNSEQPVDHLLLSDGLASVSVYMEPINPQINNARNDEEHVDSVGAIHFYSRHINDYELTVMGEVPSATVKLIAEGIVLRAPNKP